MVCDTDRGSVFVFDESKPETSFVINKNFNRFLLCLVIGLLGCGKATGVSEADKTKNAENLLETVFSMDEDMAEGFQEISGQEDLDAWADQYFGTYMTDDGLTSAMTKGVSRKYSFDRERWSVAGRFCRYVFCIKLFVRNVLE